MPRTSQAEISMRHFPDLSDAFLQIPAYQDDGLLHENRLGDLELDFDAFDDGTGDLDGDPFMTPLPKSKNHAPLTLIDLTPRAEREQQEAAASSSKARDRERVTEREREKEPSVRPVLLKIEPIDDMFARRKRDNYQQMGIDLSSKSTARLRHNKDLVVLSKQIPSSNRPRAHPSTIVDVTKMQTSQTQANDARKPKTKRPVLRNDARIAKHKPHVPPSTTQSKSILKPSKPASTLPASTFTRTLAAASHTPQAERPRWGDVVAEVQQTSQRRDSSGSGIAAMGGGLIDVLVMYGEKLKGSLGFSSSASKGPTLQGPATAADTQSPQSNDAPNNSSRPIQDRGGPSSRPLSLSDLSPLPSNRAKQDVLTLSDLSPSKQNHPLGEERHMDEQCQSKTSPTRPSTKRTSEGAPGRESKKGRLNPNVDVECPASNFRTVCEQGPISRGYIGIKVIAKPKPLSPSYTVNRIHKAVTYARSRSQPAIATDKAVPRSRLGTAASSRDLKSRGDGKVTSTTRNRRIVDKEQDPPTSISVPSGPAFTSDVYRQRALEKPQRNRERRDEKDKEKRNFNAGAMPYFNKPAPPARPAARPTVPTVFTFQSDARAAQRNVEFEEKRKTWESRATHHALPMPDFAALHAAQAEAVRGRRVVPVLPTEAPALTTMVRAKEREKFEAERRDRERAIEQQREMREKEREKQEERAYREARKRTVPKAHGVPEWYKDLPSRKEVD